MNIPRLPALIILLTVSTICVAGCGRDQSERRTSVTTLPAMLVVSGDTHGWIVPCGCTSNQSGGLPRRASYINNLRKSREVLPASVGGAAGGDSPYELLRFEAILRGERMMDVVAHNLGRSELEFGAERLRELQTRLEVPFVSSNSTDVEGTLIAEPHRLVSTSDGSIVAFIGVANPQDATKDIAISDPQTAVLNSLSVLPKDTAIIVVLAYLPEAELRELAGSIPEVDYVIGGPTGQSIVPAKVGPVTLSAATNKGKFLAEIELPSRADAAAFRGGSARGKIVEMSAEWNDDADQLGNLKWFRDQLAARDLTAQESGFALTSLTSTGDHFAGSDSCAACHASDCSVWKDSGHAHAWATLEADRSHVDSYCQQCHTTGFGMADGFISAKRSLNRVDVGCESCHGPAAAHAEDSSVKTLFRAEDQCQRCHDPENSPAFEYAGYWERIQHGS